MIKSARPFPKVIVLKALFRYIISRRSKVRSADSCALLYGYGGFSINMKPTFSAFRTVLMHNMDAVVCIANIRGGAEYGEDWHKAGALHACGDLF
jgi:prolyl oligopeptidase